MTFLDLAARRASIRGFTAEPVSEEDLAALLEAARLAPTAANRQPWHLVVVRGAEQRAALGTAYAKPWFTGAPLILVVCVEPGKAWTRSDRVNYAMVDGAIVMDHITLCAADRGLGTCWVGAFDPARLREALALPDDIEPLAMTPVGRPAAPALPKKRRPLAEFIHLERW